MHTFADLVGMDDNDDGRVYRIRDIYLMIVQDPSSRHRLELTETQHRVLAEMLVDNLDLSR